MAELDAKQIIRNSLARYGLESLADQAWELRTRGLISAKPSVDEVGDALRDTKEFKERFPANAARVARGLPELSVSEYIGLERAYSSQMRGSGLPAGFYDDPKDFQRLIEGDVSVAEVQTRINEGFRAVSEANPQVIAQMKELYGVDEAGLAAYFLDPERATPVLQRQAQAAQRASEAARQAGIQLTAQAAEGLVREGITAEEAQAGFRKIAEEQQLFTPQMIGEQQITQEEQIAGTFGIDQAARQRIETRRRRRRAEFEGGGSFAAGSTGVTGLRTS